MSFLAELSEREATGDKATIYAEIKRLGGVPMVALIYRHLATLPGGIEWMWATIGRSVEALGDAMAKAADNIVQELTAPPAPHPGVLTMCKRFGGAVIPQMIVVGALLERALP